MLYKSEFALQNCKFYMVFFKESVYSLVLFYSQKVKSHSLTLQVGE